MTTRSRSFKLAVVIAACTVLAACGSEVRPQDFVNAQGALAGAQAGNGNAGSSGGGSGVGGASSGPDAGAGGGDEAGDGLTAGGGAAGTPGGGSAGGGSAGGSGGSSGGGSAGGGGSKPATGGGASSQGGGGGGAPSVQAGSCDGFKNGQGITDKEITIATIQDVSGPVPGLFQGAQQAMKAFVAYFNSTSSICGRKLKLLSFDSQTSSGGDQQAATSACSQAFAIVGSMGAFDDGGAQTVTKCGIPDLRAATTTGTRAAQPVVFAAQSLNANIQPTGPADYYKTNYPGVEKSAAFLWLNAGAASINGEAEMKAWQTRGYNFTYSSGIPVTEFNYTSYVNAMKSKDVKYVQYVGAYQNAVRLKQAMAGQNFNPVFVLDPTGYDPGYISSGGAAVEGTHVWINSRTFEEVGQIPEMQLYEKWVKATSGKNSYFGLFAWGAGRLFTQAAIALGGKLTRASLLQALAQVDNYTGFGLFSPQHVGKKTTGGCFGYIVLQGGKWVRDKNAPNDFYCGGTANVGATG